MEANGHSRLRHLAALAALVCATIVAVPAPAQVPEQGAPLSVLLDFVVEDAQGRPILDLRADELDVAQEGVRQRVASLRPQPQPGRYELSYTPASGRAGAVTISFVRRGARARGPDGPSLKPRVVPALSALEAQLTQALVARPAAHDIECHASVLRFEASPKGLHHTLAVEVPLAELTFAKEQGRYRGRLQLLALLKDAGGRLVQRFSADRPLEAMSEGEVLALRLVWTTDVHLPPGRYALEILVQDPASSRASVDRVTFDAPGASPGFRMSSVTLLQPQSPLACAGSTTRIRWCSMARL